MKQFYLFITFILLIGCVSSKLPTKKVSQLNFPVPRISILNDSLQVILSNPVDCPIRVVLESDQPHLHDDFQNLGIIELMAKKDTVIKIYQPEKIDVNTKFNYKWFLGSLTKKVEKLEIGFPFLEKYSYTIIQANNTNYTHNTDYSRYAVDFDLKTNDTICAATNGVVVGVVEKYKHGGIGEKWNDFGNYITIYEPKSGIFTQYVHLVENGSFVQVGDKVSFMVVSEGGKMVVTAIEPAK